MSPPSDGSATDSGDRAGEPVMRGQASRPWISATGPKRRRTTVLIFVLPHAARLVFVVKQVAPVCRVVSRFGVVGHAGVNRVRFPRRTTGPKPDPGTYRITGRTRTGRLVEQVIVVVFAGGQPSRSEIEAARAADVCPSAENLATSVAGTAAVQADSPSSPPTEPAANGPALGPASLPGGVLGSTAARAARAIRPMLVALLAVAIVLLGLASLPQLAFVDRRANQLLARHRLEVAGLGAAAFIAVLITFLVD
jgi:hypothetical protein